jgi:hypothetical protein
MGQVSRSVQQLVTGRMVRESNPCGARFSSPVQIGPKTHPASCTASFPRVDSGRGVTLNLHPLLVPRSKIRLRYTSTLPKGLRGLKKGLNTHLNLLINIRNAKILIVLLVKLLITHFIFLIFSYMGNGARTAQSV